MIVAVLRVEGQELVYDTDDVEAMDFGGQRPILELPPENGAIRREFNGGEWFRLGIQFKKGKGTFWRDATDVPAWEPRRP